MPAFLILFSLFASCSKDDPATTILSASRAYVDSTAADGTFGITLQADSAWAGTLDVDF